MNPLASALALAAALLAPGLASAQSLLDQCVAQTCKARLTPDQLFGEVQSLMQAKRYDDAQPLVAALSTVPQFKLESRFLSGQIAAAKGNHVQAASFYRAILADDPSQTRVRLELGREMLAMGKPQSADKQFKIAEQADDLPDDVARTIRAVRDVIRAKRAWRLDFDFGFAPDSNINNATSVDTINVLWGGATLPLTLDDKAKARSGTGQTASISAGLRLPVSEKVAMLVDLDGAGTNYAGVDYDDFQAQIASGAELRLSHDSSISLEAVAAQRWYGGSLVSRQVGGKAGFQARLSKREQVGVQVDLRHTEALFDHSYSGWQGSAYATYERAISRSLVVSGGVFGRRDWLKAAPYSSTELGVIAGFGGELPKGITLGLSGSASHADYDAPMLLFSTDSRSDWRFTGRATLGNRKINLWGFSPQVSASYSRNDSSLPYFANDRLRFRFTLARYF
jgi:tetratricopeptide (TPR) repeat protein